MTKKLQQPDFYNYPTSRRIQDARCRVASVHFSCRDTHILHEQAAWDPISRKWDSKPLPRFQWRPGIFLAHPPLLTYPYCYRRSICLYVFVCLMHVALRRTWNYGDSSIFRRFMVYHSISWYNIFYHGIPPSYHVKRFNTMLDNAITMVYHGNNMVSPSCTTYFTMVRYSEGTMVYHGELW